MTLSRIKELGQSKIRDLGIKIIVNQNIAGFYVSVNNLWFYCFMQISKPASGLQNNFIIFV
jgi:hypothetical protein